MQSGDNRYLKRTLIPIRKERLSYAMSSICFSYAGLVGDRDYRHHQKVRKTIVQLQLKVARIESLLMLYAHRDVIEELREVCGTKDIQQVVIQLKNLRIQLQTKLAEYARAKPAMQKDRQEVYAELEASLSKYLGFPIMEKIATVEQVASYQRLLKKEKDGQQRSR